MTVSPVKMGIFYGTKKSDRQDKHPYIYTCPVIVELVCRGRKIYIYIWVGVEAPPHHIRY